jgi:hypothetical protein
MGKIKRINLEKIKKVLEEYKDELRKKYAVTEIGVFGSCVRGEQKRGSDIDILVDFIPNAKVSLLEFIELENYISDLLGCKVDLVEKSALKPRIGRNILNEVIML